MAGFGEPEPAPAYRLDAGRPGHRHKLWDLRRPAECGSCTRAFDTGGRLGPRWRIPEGAHVAPRGPGGVLGTGLPAGDVLPLDEPSDSSTDIRCRDGVAGHRLSRLAKSPMVASTARCIDAHR